jgi:hypothetical protein
MSFEFATNPAQKILGIIVIKTLKEFFGVYSFSIISEALIKKGGVVLNFEEIRIVNELGMIKEPTDIMSNSSAMVVERFRYREKCIFLLNCLLCRNKLMFICSV